MNIHQQHLLELLKEVDAFCREHDITYNCAGGTVIGAARHRGFIPWDDDIDIYMTRGEFARFAEALEADGPADRKLEYYEADHDRRAPVPRYHRDTDTMFCHFHLLGRSCAGTSLDVFILDPIPDEYEARVDYLAKLYAYCDLVAPCHVYSHRLPTSKFDVYDKYKKTADEKGVPAAVEQISEEIFNFDTSECGCYCLRWGSIPLIYPVEVIGKPVYLPFEDMMIPVPQDWYRYLVIHYGMDWMQLPYAEVQHEHVNILDYDRKYDWLYEKRDEMFDQDELLDMHFEWKDAEREFYRIAEPIDSHVKEIRDRVCRAGIDKRLKAAAGSAADDSTESNALEALFRAGKHDEIVSVYKPYLDLQLSHAYMGRRMRHGQQFRFQFPYVMPLSETELSILLASLLATGKEATAEKIAGIYERANVKSSAVSEVSEIIGLINRAARAYYMGDYQEVRRLTDVDAYSRQHGRIGGILYLDMEDIPALVGYKWLAEAQNENISSESSVELGVIANATGASESVRKAWGDLLWKSGNEAEAEKVYRSLMKTSRNGLFWLDIQGKVPDIDPIPAEDRKPFRETELTRRQRELLEEIAYLCRDNGIKYVVGPDLARRMYLTGNIGYTNSNREIFMDAAGAAKFEAAVKTAQARSGGQSEDDAKALDRVKERKLLTWKAGGKVNDMALIYCDTGSVYCDFRSLDKWKDLGISVTIRVLGEPPGLAGLKSRLLGRNGGAAYKAAAFSEVRGSKDLYYYTNINGRRPVRHSLPRVLWDDTCELGMDGVTYTIPKAMTAESVPRETDLANVPPITSVFVYSSDDMLWDEISPLIDDAAYKALDWDNYFATRKAYRRIDDKVRAAWQKMLDLDS